MEDAMAEAMAKVEAGNLMDMDEPTRQILSSSRQTCHN